MPRLPALILSLFVSLPLWYSGAQAAEIVERLQQLVENGQMNEAYEQALPHFERFAGDADYDFAFGVAAIDSGHVNQGVFALERVLMARPDDHRARLEYARGLFILGEDALARQNFTQVQQRGAPPPRVNERIDAYLRAIRLREARYQTSTLGHLSLGGGYDSNVNSAPDARISTLFGTLEANDEDDVFTALSLGAQLYHPVSKRSRLFGRWDSALRSYQTLHDQDNANHSLTLGNQWSFERHRLSLGLNGQLYLLDNSRYRELMGVEFGWTHARNKQLTLESNLFLQQLRYPDAELSWRDSRQARLNLRMLGNLELPLSPTWFAGVFYGEERADDQQDARSLALVQRDLYGAHLGGQLNVHDNLSWVAAVVWQASDYAGQDQLFAKVREDSYGALDTQFRYLLDPNWQVALQFNLSRNHSNIDLYNYRRAQTSLTLRYDF